MTQPPLPPPPNPESPFGTPPGGYGAPPPPWPGYGPPGGYYGPPQQLSPQDERLWAMLAHIGPIVLHFIAPLIVLLVQGEKSAFVRRQAVEALNFQITLAIASIALVITIIGILLLPIVLIGGVVLMILGGVKANNGEDYRYPVNLRLVK
jgi:uncharacterized Tic20 family protein